MKELSDYIKVLQENSDLPDKELGLVVASEEANVLLAPRADSVRQEHYGKDVYVRGLIEFTNYCRNNCYYCGIRAGNTQALRYRLTQEEILSCCAEGYDLGFRTFVLQGGEDLHFSDKDICSLVTGIKEKHPDCAVTLSVGEKERASYKAYFDAGADRYLLRHETACDTHYRMLHPESLSLANRKRCLWDLKEIGYQVGSGFMVGSPYQSTENLVADLRFLQELEPDMIGIGPFLSHKDTPFKNQANGSFTQSIRLVSILRLMFPYALIPATTALGTIHPQGREMGIKAGANVVMPNLSPLRVRKLYQLYDNKISTGEESAQCIADLKKRMEGIGYKVVSARGDVKR
ncbi:MAG: [FeFe] hydrogenase H-cluster radical SAM maturase HydE [Phascolarctobacterium sp.]|nr:[FeFe] hydrogenase H-cluster radical SAM maturase HydE [Phascolarctobacterium sp.]